MTRLITIIFVLGTIALSGCLETAPVKTVAPIDSTRDGGSWPTPKFFHIWAASQKQVKLVHGANNTIEYQYREPKAQFFPVNKALNASRTVLAKFIGGRTLEEAIETLKPVRSLVALNANAEYTTLRYDQTFPGKLTYAMVVDPDTYRFWIVRFGGHKDVFDIFAGRGKTNSKK